MLPIHAFVGGGLGEDAAALLRDVKELKWGLVEGAERRHRPTD